MIITSGSLARIALVVAAALPNATFASSLKDLAIEALLKPSGRSSGQIDGDAARTFRALLRTDLPIQASVVRLEKYRQEGCGRLQIELDVPGQTVKTKSGEQQPMATGFRMDLCVDGQAPVDKRPA